MAGFEKSGVLTNTSQSHVRWTRDEWDMVIKS